MADLSSESSRTLEVKPSNSSQCLHPKTDMVEAALLQFHLTLITTAVAEAAVVVAALERLRQSLLELVEFVKQSRMFARETKSS